MTVSLITVDDCDLGIRAISKYLKANNVRTRLILLPSKSHYPIHVLKQLFGMVSESDLIGISFRQISLSRAIRLYNALKPLRIPIVVGGSTSLVAPQYCIKYFDCVCYTDGEKVVLDMYNLIISGKDPYAAPGLYVKRDRKIVKNNQQALDKNISFDYDCDNQYMLLDNRIRKITKPPLFYTDFGVFRKDSLFIMSSRACHFKCSYCINSKLSAEIKFRRNTISQLIEHINEVKQKYPLKYIYLFDDDFQSRSLADIEEFSRLYKKHINLPFWSYCSPKTVSKEKIMLLLDCGLTNLSMGIQSASGNTNHKIYDREISGADIFLAAKVINETCMKRLIPVYDLLINNPIEPTEYIYETLDVLKLLPTPFFLYCHHLIMFPGSKIHEEYPSHYAKGNLHVHDQKLINHNRKDLYINSTLLWSQGLWTESRCGIIPRTIFQHITKPKNEMKYGRNKNAIHTLNNIYYGIRHLNIFSYDRNKSGVEIMP